MHPSYQSLILNRVINTIEMARSLRCLTHNGLKGELREVVIREMLEPFLPPGCVIGTGEIVTAYEDTSNQIDVVIADRTILPPVLIRDSGIFPIESCLMTIEIKSKLTAGELKKADKSARHVAKFRHAPPVGENQHPEREIEHVIPFLLAFETDLVENKKSEVQRYLDSIGNEHPAIHGLCVIGRGYWFQSIDGWVEGTLPVNHGELVGMMSDVINVAQRIKNTRRQPDIREYLIWDHPVIKNLR